MSDSPAPEEKLSGGAWFSSKIPGWETKSFSTGPLDFPDPIFSIVKLEG